MRRLLELFGRSRPTTSEPPLTRWDVALVVFQVLGILLALVGLTLRIVENLR